MSGQTHTEWLEWKDLEAREIGARLVRKFRVVRLPAFYFPDEVPPGWWMKIISVRGEMLELQVIETGWKQDAIADVAIVGHLSLMAALEIMTEERITRWLSMKEMGHKTPGDGLDRVGHPGLLKWVRENEEEWGRVYGELEKGGWERCCEGMCNTPATRL